MTVRGGAPSGPDLLLLHAPSVYDFRERALSASHFHS
jgi:hypothetical protein